MKVLAFLVLSAPLAACSWIPGPGTNPYPARIAEACFAGGGRWDENRRECREVAPQWCAAQGGSYTPAHDRCGHVVPGASCKAPPTAICKFGQIRGAGL